MSLKLKTGKDDLQGQKEELTALVKLQRKCLKARQQAALPSPLLRCRLFVRQFSLPVPPSLLTGPVATQHAMRLTAPSLARNTRSSMYPLLSSGPPRPRAAAAQEIMIKKTALLDEVMKFEASVAQQLQTAALETTHHHMSEGEASAAIQARPLSLACLFPCAHSPDATTLPRAPTPAPAAPPSALHCRCDILPRHHPFPCLQLQSPRCQM